MAWLVVGMRHAWPGSRALAERSFDGESSRFAELQEAEKIDYV